MRKSLIAGSNTIRATQVSISFSSRSMHAETKHMYLRTVDWLPQPPRGQRQETMQRLRCIIYPSLSCYGELLQGQKLQESRIDKVTLASRCIVSEQVVLHLNRDFGMRNSSEAIHEARQDVDSFSSRFLKVFITMCHYLVLAITNITAHKNLLKLVSGRKTPPPKEPSLKNRAQASPPQLL